MTNFLLCFVAVVIFFDNYFSTAYDAPTKFAFLSLEMLKYDS